MGLPIFYLPLAGRPAPGSEIDITGPEAHHLLRSLRARPGEKLLLGDGERIVVDAVLTDVDPTSARARVTGVRDAARASLVLVLRTESAGSYAAMIIREKYGIV